MPLTAHSHRLCATSLGGNLHNEYIENDTTVAIYKAVEIKQQKLCHVGNYVAYQIDLKVASYVASYPAL